MASGRTCAHTDQDRLHVSGTQLRKWLSEGSPVPAEFSRPEVLDVLRSYYASLAQGVKAGLDIAGHSSR
jgi:sulfate adenylyltransferase